MKDDRPLVKDLLAQHATKLDELRAIIEKEDTYSKDHYDDIWMLRFLLSHKKVSKASAAAVKTMKFRKEKGLNEMGDVRWKVIDHTNLEDTERIFPESKKYIQFCKDPTSLMLSQPDLDRGVVQVITPRHIDTTAIVENMTVDEVIMAYAMGNEIAYQILDEVTRRTGRLTKMMRVVDLTDLSFSHFSMKYTKLDSTAAKMTENFYPQMLGRVIIFNAPGWTNKIWSVCKKLLPQAVIEKMSFVQPGKGVEDFLKYVSEDSLWEYFGGKNKEWPVAPPRHLWKKK